MQTMSWKVLPLVLLLLASLVSSSRAAEHYREGRLIIGAYLGVGEAWLGDEVPDDGASETGIGGNFRIGYGVNRSLFVGIETSAWSDVTNSEDGDVDLTFRTFGPSVAWYPGGKGFYLRGIVGWSWLDLELTPTGSPTYKLDADGFGLAAAMGWEWRVTPSLAIGPQIDLGYMDVGEVPALTMNLGESFPFTAYWVNVTVFAVLYL